jgi:hypothetical protein
MYIAVTLFLVGKFIGLGDVSVLIYCVITGLAFMAFFTIAIAEGDAAGPRRRGL